MTINTAYNRLKSRKLLLTAGALLGAVIAMGGSFFLDLEYKTSSSFIIVQEQRFADPFAQSRSADYLSGLLTRIVGTDSFRQAVFDENAQVKNAFSVDVETAREQWQKGVQAKAIPDSGILNIEAYSENQAFSSTLVEAIGASLTTESASYLGQTSSVSLLQIDGPITSEYPVRPNVGLNSLAGALVGLTAMGSIILVRTPRKYGTNVA